MAEEEKPEQRPKCQWPVKDGTCNSEERIFKVKSGGGESNICAKHLPDVIKVRDWESAVPVDLPEKR